jgi:hypothetical protein
MKDLPPPLGAVGTFLQAIADGQEPPPIPPDLPPKIAEILQALAKELEEVKS